MKTEGDRKFLKWLFHITCSLLRSLKEKNSSWRRPRIDTQVIFVLTLLQKHHGFNLGCPNVLLSSAQFSWVNPSCLTLWDPMNCSMPGLLVHHQTLESIQTHITESVMPSTHLTLCHPLLLLPPIFLSIRVFSNESTLCIRWSKYWSFSFNISPSNEYSGLISFRMDWLDLLAGQGTLKSLLQHQFKSINSLALSLQYSPNLTSIHDHWKNHSLD